MNLPNKLTILRIIIIPFMLAAFYLPEGWNVPMAAAVFVLAYATDAVDGYLARRNGQVTDFGKLMDPIADKLLSASAFVMLAAFGMAHPVAVVVILSREFIISGFRLVCAEKGVIIAASKWGKAKTVSQFIAVLAVFAAYIPPLDKLPAAAAAAQALIWVSAALAIISGADYIIKNKGCIASF